MLAYLSWEIWDSTQKSFLLFTFPSIIHTPSYSVIMHLGMHQVLGVHVFAQRKIRVWGTVQHVCFLISHLPSCTPKTLPSKHMQEGGMEPGTHEGKVNARKRMLYPLIHIAGRLRLWGMLARTRTLLYVSKLKFILLHRKQIKFSFGVKKLLL